LGFGLLRALHSLAVFPRFRSGLEGVLAVVLGVLACLSFRDAYCFKKTGEARDVILQLPDTLKLWMHGVLRRGLGIGSLVAGGLVIGAVVTVVESICTGQVYVPMLVLVIKSGTTTAAAVAYLLLYNAMFILPLVVVFALSFFGLRTRTLMDWSKRNVAVSKILLGVFFLVMATVFTVL
jgi:hypothetical protein